MAEAAADAAAAQSAQELADAHALSVSRAQALLGVIHRVEARQTYWKGELEHHFASEAAQHEQHAALRREVMVDEVDALSNGQFVDWMARREGSGVGAEGIEEWFHDDRLLALTPFVAVVPCPRQLTAAGLAAIVDVIDGFQLYRIYVRNVAIPLTANAAAAFLRPARALDIDATATGTIAPAAAAAGEGESETQSLPTVASVEAEAEQRKASLRVAGYDYLRGECASGADVAALIARSERLRAALELTPCLLLSDASLGAAETTALVTAFVVGGLFVAAEVDDVEERDAANATTLPKASPAKSPKAAAGGASAVDLAALQAFVAQIVAVFPTRSFSALVAVSAKAPEVFLSSGGADDATAAACGQQQRFALLNIALVDSEAPRCFTTHELLAVAQYHSRRKKQLGAAVSIAPVVRRTRDAPPGLQQQQRGSPGSSPQQRPVAAAAAAAAAAAPSGHLPLAQAIFNAEKVLPPPLELSAADTAAAAAAEAPEPPVVAAAAPPSAAAAAEVAAAPGEATKAEPAPNNGQPVQFSPAAVVGIATVTMAASFVAAAAYFKRR